MLLLSVPVSATLLIDGVGTGAGGILVSIGYGSPGTAKTKDKGKKRCI